MDRQTSGVVISLIMLTFFGWILYDTIFIKCYSDCEGLVLLSLGVIIGANLLLESYIQRLKDRGEWHKTAHNQDKVVPPQRFRHAWFVSTARIVLASILIGLPFIWQASFAIIVISILFGLMINTLYRAVTDQMIPLSSDENDA